MSHRLFAEERPASADPLNENAPRHPLPSIAPNLLAQHPRQQVRPGFGPHLSHPPVEGHSSVPQQKKFRFRHLKIARTYKCIQDGEVPDPYLSSLAPWRHRPSRLARLLPLSLSFAFLACLPARAALDPLNRPAVHVDLGPEQLVTANAGWPYLFQSAEGTTVVLGHRYWLPKQPEPIVFTVRSFDRRKTWQEWTPSKEQGSGPVTEGVAVQLKDGRIAIFDVYAYHQGAKRFTGKRWISKDGWRTVTGPEVTSVSVPQALTEGMVDDRGEPISRLYLRRSAVLLKSGDLLAAAYGRFEGDDVPVEYIPAMKQCRSYLLRSSDEGLTWTFAGTIATPPVGQEGFGEPVIIQLQHGPRAGRLICQMRVGREHAIYQTESDDEGKTWSAPRALSWTYSRFGRQREIIGVDPDLTEMSNGVLVMGYGHKPDYRDDGNFLAFSVDQGVTWTAETRLSSAITIAYVGVREVSPGNLFAVYTKTAVTRASEYKGAVFDTYGREIQVQIPPPLPAAPAKH